MQKTKTGLHPALKIVAMVAALGAGFWTRESIEAKRVVIQPSASISTNPSEPNSQTLASLGDNKVAETQLFLQILDLLETNYVDGVKDPMVVAVGSVRGMVNRLMDPDAIFLGKEEFAALEKIQDGKIEGIGVELYFSYDRTEIKKFKKFQLDLLKKKVKIEDADKAYSQEKLIPDLLVRSIAPGSPAESAGLRPGDRIEKIDSRWVYSAHWVDELTKLSNKIRDGKLTSDQVTAIRKQIKEQADNNMVPARAYDVLTINLPIKDDQSDNAKAPSKVTSNVSVVWKREGELTQQKATITKGLTEIPPIVQTASGEYALQFIKGSPQALRALVDKGQPFTINFKNTVYGNLELMKECLSILIPSGEYGAITTKKGADKFAIKGDSKGGIVTLIANKHIDGSARIFASIFASVYPSQVTGLSNSTEPVVLKKLVKMPNASGYTLPYGEFTFASGVSK